MLKAWWTRGGVDVDLMIANPKARPGDTLSGEVVIYGGKVERRIEGLGLELFITVWVSSGDGDGSHRSECTLAERSDLLDAFTLAPSTERRIPFTFDVPWETPLTLEGGQKFTRRPFHIPLPDDSPTATERVRLRTELAIDRSRDRSDTDPLEIHALPAHAGVFAALERIGFWFNRVELDRAYDLDIGVEQTFIVNNAPDYPFALVLKFRTDASKVDVQLEGSRQDRRFTRVQRRDWYLVIEHAQVDGFDFEGALRDALDKLAGDWRA